MKKVVFIHAFPLNSAMWEEQAAMLEKKGFDIWTPDLPGFGGRSAGAENIETWAREILEECDRRDITEAIFVGLSMGGYVIFRIAELAKERISALVLADTRATADNEAGRERRNYLAARVRRDGVSFLADEMLPLLLGRTSLSERPWLVEKVRKMILEADSEGAARALIAMRDRPDSSRLLQELKMPALVLVGDEDTLTPPEEAKFLASLLPCAKFHVIPKAGHLSNLENPEAFNRYLLEFLEEQ